jgi:hypothetical protein
MSDLLKQDKSNKDEKIKSYSYSERKKLSSKIMNIKKKDDYIKLFKLINQDPNNKFTENSNGIWLDFKSLSDQTISKVEKYLIKLKNKSDEDSVNSLEYVPYSTEENFNNLKNSGPKLSNYEKSILRRNKYSDE